MKVDRTLKKNTSSDEYSSRAQFVKNALRNTPFRNENFKSQSRDNEKYHSNRIGRSRDTDWSERNKGSKSPAANINLFGSESLQIFNNSISYTNDTDCMDTWTYLNKRDLKLAVTHPPSNYFEKLIIWSEQNKIWNFPIDNEQGFDSEKKVYFADHIFLEQHLEGWCPKKGPVSHFMELVCVGLSKNPYITVDEKINHILWFKDYFSEKKDLLKELISVQSDNNTKESKI